MYLLTAAGCLLICLVLHELGHIFLLTLHGYSIRTVCIGLPLKPWVRISIKACALSIYLSPYLWGATTISDMSRKPESPVWLQIILAGPLVNLTALSIASFIGGWSEFVYIANAFIDPSQYPLAFWQWFIVLNSALGFGELVPFVSSDGTELLRILQGTSVREVDECSP